MRIPKFPPVGSLIAYEYLWESNADRSEDGAKTYPVAVVLARRDVGPLPLAYVAAISHSPPRDDQRAIEVPRKLKRVLGLDDEPAWLYTDQLNVFIWPGPDIREGSHLSSLPLAEGSCVIGTLPADWFEKVKEHLRESFELNMVRALKRTR